MEAKVLEYAEKNREFFLENLKELIRIESISTQPEKKEAILHCAHVEMEKFKKAGLENVTLLKTCGYPLVYGDWLHAPNKPTLLIYGHYDVQPPDPLEEWKTPPFEPTVKNGNLYGRGTCDNKAQHFSHLCAIEAYLKTVKKLPLNVKVILEGEEECGGKGIEEFVSKNPKLLACDAVLVSDSPWHDFDHPSIEYSLRGLAYFEIRVKGPSHDLHSGLYGGMVRNPAQVLSWILSKLKDEEERVLIPHFYDDVLEISPDEKKALAAVPFEEESLKREIGVKDLACEKGFTLLEANGCRPTLEINGVWGGYQKAGAKTIIPATAGAKVSARLVANQKAEKIDESLKKYISSITPKGVCVEVELLHTGLPFYVDCNHPYLRKTAKAYGEAFGKEVIFKRDGASIPVTAIFQDVLKAPVILIGLGLPDDRMHSPNEKISLANFYNGIKGAALTYAALAE